MVRELELVLNSLKVILNVLELVLSGVENNFFFFFFDKRVENNFDTKQSSFELNWRDTWYQIDLKSNLGYLTHN